jgi:hypothetical protein
MKKLLIPIFLVFCSLTFSQEFKCYQLDMEKYISPNQITKYQIKSSHEVFLLGWSKNGKMAYINQIFSGRPGFNLTFYIINTITDKISFESKSWNPIDEEIDSGKEYKVTENQNWADLFLSLNKIEFLSVLSKYEILPLSTTQSISALPITINNIKYNLSSSIKVIDAGEESLIYKGSYLLKINNGKSSIELTDKNNHISYFLFVEPIAYMKSPYESRIVIINCIYSWGIEDTNYIRYEFIGCGFSNNF